MLIVEDGTGLPDADSYVAVASFVAWAAARNITIPAGTPAQEDLLRQAFDYMETLNYKGERSSHDQSASWPRTGVTLHGYTLLDTDMPATLAMAQMQLAVDAITIPLLQSAAPSATGAVVEQRVEGAVTVKYAPPGSGTGGTPSLPRAMALLRHLLRGTWAQLPVVRV